MTSLAVGLLALFGPSAFDEAQIESGTKLLAAVHASNTSKNGCVSPYSIQSAATLLRVGAAGDTDRELATLLEQKDVPAAAFAGKFAQLRPTVDKYTSLGVLSCANAVWSVDPLLPEFEKVAIEQFGAKTARTTFPQPGLDLINRWVSESTKGLIPGALEDLDPQTEVVLANAVWFKDSWIKAFDPDSTLDSKFKLQNGEEVKVKSLTAPKMFFASGAIDGGRVYQLNMNHSSLLVYTPDSGCAAALGSEGWRKALQKEVKLEMKNGLVVLPKVEFATDLDLLKAWVGMGMKLTNSPRADFSRMSRQKTFLSKAIHKVFLKWDELGAEGAVSTILSNGRGAHAEADMMRIDRPFLFAIFSREMLLFMGYVEDPRAK